MAMKESYFLLGLSLAVSCLLGYAVNSVITQPYMDELFHVRQTEKYMALDFLSWDDKITTPPALYVVCSVLAFVPAKWFSTLFVLRSVNVVFSLLFYGLVEVLTQNASAAFSIMLFPPLYFVSLLFYTDVLSTFLVVLSFTLLLRNVRSHSSRSLTQLHGSALVALLAVMVRQTNIIWAFFNAGFYVLTEMKHTKNHQIKELMKACLDCGSYVIVGLSFVVFVYLNKGVALGDRFHHQISPHLAQVVYYYAFLACFLPGNVLQHIILPAFPQSWLFTFSRWARPMGKEAHQAYLDLCSHKRRLVVTKWKVVGWFVWNILAWAFLTKFSYVHVFVLSDNRHYTFYLWRRLLGVSSPVKCILLLPLSTVGVTLAQSLLQDHSGFIQALYYVCVLGSIATTPLLEFRYFIPPFVILLLLSLTAKSGSEPRGIGSESFERCSRWAFRLNATLYTLVNGVTLYVFLRKPFQAPDGSVGRFMW